MKLSAMWQWVIVLTTLVVGLTACNENNSSSNTSAGAERRRQTSGNSPAAASADPVPAPATATAVPDAATGEMLYAKGNCAMCHGQSGEGGKLGPALTGLTANGWDTDKLMAYLADPKDHSVNAKHLASIDSEYSMTMPAFTGTAEERAQLAAWLLGR